MIYNLFNALKLIIWSISAWIINCLQKYIVKIFFSISFSSEASGDCLYSSLSTYLVGNNYLTTELRLLCSIELFLNSEFYANHPLFLEIFSKHSDIFVSIRSIFVISLSDAAFNSQSLSSVKLIELEAINICSANVWSSFVCILALSEILKTDIRVHYPDFGDIKYKCVFNNLVYPQENSSQFSEINLLFCRHDFSVFKPSASTYFVPNHFVPLVMSTSHNTHSSCLSKKRKLASSSTITCGQSKTTKQVVSKKKLSSTTVYHFFKKDVDGIRKKNFPSTSSENCSSSSVSNSTIISLSPTIPFLSSVTSLPTIITTTTATITTQLKLTPSLTLFTPTTLPSTSPKISPTTLQSKLPSTQILTKQYGGSKTHKFDIACYREKVANLSESDILQLIKNVFVPEATFVFPSVVIPLANNSTELRPQKQLTRRFSHAYLTDYPWLKYSPSLNGGLCLPCVLFGHLAPQKLSKVKNLVTKAVIASKDSRSALKRHASSGDTLHSFSKQHFNTFLNRMNRNVVPITAMVDSLRSKRIKENRQVLFPIVDTIIFCGRQGLPLRGHRDSSKNFPDAGKYSCDIPVGNFIELINFRIRGGDQIMKEHYEKHSANASYLSHITQNEIVRCCGEVITDSIISDIKESNYFSILADEVMDSLNKEQLSLVLRYVDKNFNIKESFVKFIHLATGLSGKSLADSILSSIYDLGLDITDCRGQGYDGASSVSGHINGCSAHILSRNRKALYVHCFSHRLNLTIAHACSVDSVKSMLLTIKQVSDFFNMSEQRQQGLELNIKRFCSDSRKLKLKDVCRTRWVERINGLDVFEELFPAILNTLENMESNEPLPDGRYYNNNTRSNASIFLPKLLSFAFIVNMVITRSVFDLTLGVTQLLQSKSNDIADGVDMIESLLVLVTSIRNNIQFYHNKWYLESLELANQFHVTEAKKRSVKRQINRANHPASDISTFYKVFLSIPIIEHLQSQLNTRFTESNLISYTGLYIIPSKIVSMLKGEELKDWKECAKPFFKFYEEDLPNPKALSGELLLWERFWMDSKNVLPNNVSRTLKSVPFAGFENIKVCLRILATLPVTSCECERSFSSLRRLKDYTRSRMVADRLNGLALMYIHQDIIPEVGKIIDKFAASGTRRLELSL